MGGEIARPAGSAPAYGGPDPGEAKMRLFHVVFVVATIGLSLVVATGLAVVVTALLAVLMGRPGRSRWRTGGGTA